MIVGVVGGSWGTAGAADVKSIVNYVRLDQNELSLTTFQNHWNAGLKICVLFAGPYNSGGVQAINRSSWISGVLSWYKAHTNPTQSPLVEILNEPGGSWFWGGSANSASNAAAYGALVHDAAVAFHNEYGDKCPVILASVDGGSASGNSGWGNNVWRAIPNAATLPVYGTIHPYQGSSGSNGPDANRNSITAAHTFTGKPIYVTELGWPTCGSTSDSPNNSESQQASKITSFYNWAKSTGYVAAFFYYNYRDESSSRCYGIEGHDGRTKPGKGALHNASLDSGGPTPPPPPPPNNPPNVAFALPQTLTGKVAWTANAADDSGIKKVEFYIDGVLGSTEGFAPYVYGGDGATLDTATLTNGTHTLKVIAYSNDNATATASQDVTVNNAAPPPPPPTPDADLKALYDLVEALRKAGGYRVQTPPANSADAAKAAYINLGQAMQGLATKYGLPFV